MILHYKERGRYALVSLLAELLSAVVSAAVPGRRGLLLIPVPATARAIRQRRGDHVLRLAREVAACQRRLGRPAVVLQAMRSRRRPDSAGLDARRRAAVARAAYTPRPGIAAAVRRLQQRSAWNPYKPGVSGTPAVVVLDDVMTTGATLIAVCEGLTSVGLPVTAAAVLAATARRGRHER